MSRSFYSSRGKRFLDLALIVLAAPFLLPLLAIVALAVYAALGRPVFYYQLRSGLRGTPFRVIKFRTMTSETDSEGRLLPDDRRLTGFGKGLRSMSLDELPEILNVIRGEMSLVGPRPLLARYLERYTVRQKRRLESPPGITGWSQINGRNSIDWNDKFELDVWYVDRIDWVLDMKILARTVGAVVSRKGISAGADSTMPEFMGEAGTDRKGRTP